MAEDIGIENRAGYYDQAGALRDMLQNHLMQILTLVAMEPPPSLEADSLRDEKVKVLRSIRPIPKSAVTAYAMRAQYGPGIVHNKHVPGYQRQNLHQVILQHIAQSTGLVIIAGPVFNADIFGHGYLDVVDVIAVPDRLDG